MFLQLFKGRGVQAFAKKNHTQMCIASLFRQEQQHRKVENEWNDDEDEQRQIFDEDEKNRGHAVPLTPCPYLKGGVRGERTSSGLVHCTHENKSDTYIIHYEGGTGIISR